MAKKEKGVDDHPESPGVKKNCGLGGGGTWKSFSGKGKNFTVKKSAGVGRNRS